MLSRICVSLFILISFNTALAATSTKPQVPRPSNDILKNNSPDNTEIEVRLDGDFTDDGLNDKDGDYVDQPPVTKKVSSKAIYMKDTPNPCVALACLYQ